MTKAREFKLGYPHHIYNRGNRKEKIFFKPKDYNVFLKQLKKYAKKFECNLLGYCLMPNHYHLILQPMGSSSISNTMHRTTVMYSKYLKLEYKWTGHVFQGRYQSKLVKDWVYLKQVVKYIKNNPLEAELTGPNGDYKWLKIYDEKIAIQQQIFNPGLRRD